MYTILRSVIPTQVLNLVFPLVLYPMTGFVQSVELKNLTLIQKMHLQPMFH